MRGLDNMPIVGVVMDINRYATDHELKMYNMHIGRPVRAQIQMTEDATMDDLEKIFKAMKCTRRSLDE